MQPSPVATVFVVYADGTDRAPSGHAQPRGSAGAAAQTSAAVHAQPARTHLWRRRGWTHTAATRRARGHITSALGMQQLTSDFLSLNYQIRRRTAAAP
jgi:hypothetical protein